MFPPFTLEGDHVRLEPLSLGHVAGLTAASSGQRETFAYTWVQGGRVVGSTRFFNFEYLRWPEGTRSPGEPPDAVEIGWTWLAPDAQRTALNTEAKLLMLT